MSSYTESEEYKKRLLEKQNAFLERVAKSNGQTVEQLTNYGNNAELLDKAANGEAVTISTPNTDAKKAAYYSQQAATPVSSYYDFLAKNALDTKGVTYAMAEKMRQESEALAEIQRKRSIVDASTMAEQQKATYGANAEQMGRMGLSGSGYSDYLNSQAYAAGMAGRQAANAQATDANRKAMYTEQMAKLEADKEYNNALAQIETAKYNEQREDKAQQQTNYGKLIDAIINGNGTINKDNVATYASALGITDTKLLGDAENFATTYGENTPKTLTESDLLQINNAYDAAIQDGDYITAGDKYIEGTHYTASEEQKKTYLASFMVENITNVDDSQWKTIADKIAKGDYGTKGGERIKEAFSNSEYVAAADKLDEKSLKSIIDSGLLTDEAQSKLDVMYANKYEENDTKQTTVYSTDVFDKYVGSNNPKSKQSKYVKAIIEMVDSGELEKGEYVMANYGDTANPNSLYKYLGNGKFEPIKEYSSGENLKNIVKLPDGYHWFKDSSTGKYIVVKDKE